MSTKSYGDIVRHDSGVIERGRRIDLVSCPVQPRDVELVASVRRYKFLTAPQLLELWWPGRGPRAGQRRLLRLFEAGYLDRFRPMSRRGSLPWTYHLGREGHHLLKRAGFVGHRVRFEQQEIYDYRYVLHEIHLNGWILAYRRELGETLLRWEGETEIEPPRHARSAQLRLDDDWSVEGLAASRPRMIRPDATLDIAGHDGGEQRILLLEYDRTRRVDKNFEKFRRYDSFLVGWWRHTEYSDRQRPPYTVFVCQDEGQVLAFLEAADCQLTGHLWHPSARPAEYRYAGRDRVVFTSEGDVHSGRRTGHLVAPYPPGHPERSLSPSCRVVQLPGPLSTRT